MGEANTTSTATGIDTENSNVPEATILFISTAIGCLGNTAAIVIILANHTFRKSSTAFICHHCLLDCIKSLYCFLYGYHFLKEEEVPVCHIVGASYVLFVTVSAYNLLAIVVNEEYEFKNPPPGNNHFCVLFGIFIVWFMCILMNMGVAFLPKEPEFIPEIGTCMFLYGSPSNFVLHILWMVLVSMAVFMSLSHFISMYIRIRHRTLGNQWSSIHQSILNGKEPQDLSNEDPFYYASSFADAPRRSRYHTHLYLRRVTILLLMVTSFILFWYPLFMLTIVDYRYQQPKEAYRVLTILSWCHPATTPFFVFFILYDMSQKDGILRRIYSDNQPMMPFLPPLGSPTRSPRLQTLDTGTYNLHFEQRHRFFETDSIQLETMPCAPTCTTDAEPQVKIEKWDSSPKSPGKRLQIHLNH